MAVLILPVSIEPMRSTDLDAVQLIDKMCFSAPWTVDAYVTELSNRSAQYFVARIPGAGEVVGYSGIWVVNGEGHITTLGVAPEYHRRGVGQRLLETMLEEARFRRAKTVALEVRSRNRAALSMYAKYGFLQIDRHAGYYADNGDDALVMQVALL